MRALFNAPLLLGTALAFSLLITSAGCGDDENGTGDGDTSTDGETTTETGTATTDTSVDTTDTLDTGVPGDTVEDTADTTGPLNYCTDVPEPNIARDPSNCSAVGGALNIYDIQDSECPDYPIPFPVGTQGEFVELSNVVVTGTFGDTMFVQDPEGGAFSGLTVFNNSVPIDDLVPGTVINIEGDYSEFFENTQLYLRDFTIVSQGGAPPAPYIPAHPAHIATNGAVAEMMEGVLVRVENLVTIHTRPDCPQDFGEFAVDCGVRIDDMAEGLWDARLGDTFTSITGPLVYAFGNFKIEPRTAADIVWTEKGQSSAISKCIASECNAPAELAGTKEVIISEHMPDPFGDDTNKEWIEFHNPGALPVNINGWAIRDCGDQSFILNGPNLTIAGGGYLVIGMSSNFNANGGVGIDLAYGFEFYLPNTVGAVLLYNGSDMNAQLVDQMRYSRFEDWADIFRAGHSLERKNLTGDGTVPSNWDTGDSEFGDGNFGTPGETNDAR
ncbi:MAG: hypothetical protein ACI9MR_000442 [Myxococcota bacterium]|jgi:hypothetical protein